MIRRVCNLRFISKALFYPFFCSGLTLPNSERDIVEKARDLLQKIPAGAGIPQRFMVVTLISIERY